MKTLFNIFILGVISLNANSQNVFKDKVDPCITKMFSLEKDSLSVTYPSALFVKELRANFAQKDSVLIEGTLELQILIDTLGQPCLYSLTNSTNKPTSDLNLSESINKQIWTNKADQKIAALIKISFYNDFTIVRRMMLHYENGWNWSELLKEVIPI